MEREDIEFLRELQNELRTQTNDGNANPTYWGVMETVKEFAPKDCGEPMICDGESVMTLEEAIQMVDNSDELTEDEKEEWDNICKEDMDDVVDFLNNFLGDDYEVVYVRQKEFISRETGAFLTKRACQQYIDRFGYNHTRPRTYAMTAYRNFELERLLKILTNMDIDDIKEE